MEKTILIGGHEINFKATGGTLCIYKQQFGTEYFEDVLKITEMQKVLQYTAEDVYLRQYKVGYQLIWSMAKNADKNIPDPEKWAKQFESFPMSKILPQVTALFRSPEDGGNSKDGESITSESLCACAIACGLTMEDVYEMPLDFLVNCISESIELKGGKKKDRVRKATQQDFMRF